MACFIVPLTQALATTAIRRRIAKSASDNTALSHWQSQLPRLEAMLYGGSAMLIVDHIISGELVATNIVALLGEVLTVGVPMSLVVTAIWGICFGIDWAGRREKQIGQDKVEIV